MAASVLSALACEPLVELARNAGSAIMAFYAANDGADLQFKADDSPLTAADLAAHQLLVAGLPKILDIPIISEESVLPSFAERSGWGRYWLIDPLDGTKEFVQRNGEFTVNIALIEQGIATFGVVHIPVSDTTYVGINPPGKAAKTALKYRHGAQVENLRVRSVQVGQPLAVLASHRHGTDRLTALVARLRARWSGDIVSTQAGSSLKFCLIAEGRADFYPRLAPTSEWDTAAAQAVLEAAGGAVVVADATDGEWQPLRYNSRESIINPFFYALGDSSFDWRSLLLSGSK